jgi:hypothetical protein
MKDVCPVVFKTTAVNHLATFPVFFCLKIMEVTGVEPVTCACKAKVLPAKLYPPLFFSLFIFHLYKKQFLSVSGLEPESRGLKGRCSTIELYTQFYK